MEKEIFPSFPVCAGKWSRKRCDDYVHSKVRLKVLFIQINCYDLYWWTAFNQKIACRAFCLVFFCLCFLLFFLLFRMASYSCQVNDRNNTHLFQLWNCSWRWSGDSWIKKFMPSGLNILFWALSSLNKTSSEIGNSVEFRDEVSLWWPALFHWAV